MSMPVFAIPTPGVVGGRPRREPLQDTEVVVGGSATAVPSSIVLFQNFSQFRAAPNNTNVAQAKEVPRDTNLQQGVTGLPQSYHFLWYGWRMKYKTYLAVLSTEANAVVFEEINRLRDLGGVAFNFAQTVLIQTALDELPAGVGAQYANTTHTGATVLSLPNGVPDRHNFKDVTVGGQPTAIAQLQPFNVTITWPDSSGLLPLVDIFPQCELEGILIKGITG